MASKKGEREKEVGLRWECREKESKKESWIVIVRIMRV